MLANKLRGKCVGLGYFFLGGDGLMGKGEVRMALSPCL